MSGESYSCTGIHGAIYLAPDELRHCCQRFFVNNEMRGDVRIFKVSSDADLSVEKILHYKQDLYERINRGLDTPCRGCPSLLYDFWPPLDRLRIQHLSIEAHTFCNLKCSYCSDVYYGGKKPQYNILTLVKKLIEGGVCDPNISLVWGGGEPLLLDSFDEMFSVLTSTLRPSHNNVFTNAVVYNDTLEKYLKEGLASIVTSVDAGTHDVFKKIKNSNKFEQVFANLSRYHQLGGNRVTIKYVLLPENSSEEELTCFVHRVVSHELIHCIFQISTNFKNETLDSAMVYAAISLHKKLKNAGSKTIFYDEHLKKRISMMHASEWLGEAIAQQSLVVWGTGEHARHTLKNSVFLSRNKIEYFVDSDPNVFGKFFHGYEIRSPETLLDNHHKIFICSVSYYGKIYRTLLDMGISEERIVGDML